MAVGAAEQSQRGGGDPSGPVRPDDKVRMVPLPGSSDDQTGTGADRRGGAAPSAPGEGGGSDDSDGSGGEGADADGGAGNGGGGSGGGESANGAGDSAGDRNGAGTVGGGDGGGSPSSGSPSPGGSTGGGGSSPSSGGAEGGGDSTPGGPAVLKVSEPQRAKAGDRWCEKVTVEFRNTGGSPVKKGKVTFGTHIIGSLGVDWDTRASTRAVPVPLAAGEKKEKTWTVCVDRWRVPLGMRVETRDVRVSDWK